MTMARGEDIYGDNVWLKRQFAWNPDDFDGDIEACVEAWFEDTVERFQPRTGFSFNNVGRVSYYSNFENMREVLKQAMRDRIQNRYFQPLSLAHHLKIGDGVYNGPGTQVFDKIVSNHDEGLRPGEYRRMLVSAEDAAQREGFIRRCGAIINNTPEFVSKHPVTGEPIDTERYDLRISMSYPEGFYAPTFTRVVRTETLVEGTDLSALPVEVVAEWAVLGAILEKGTMVGTGAVPAVIKAQNTQFPGQMIGPIMGIAAKRLAELGYGKGLNPIVDLDEVQAMYEAISDEYNIRPSGLEVTEEEITESNVPVMKMQLVDLVDPANSLVEMIRIEDFFFTHRNEQVLQDQVARFMPPIPQLSPDLYPHIGGTTEGGWRQVGGRSGSYIIKFSRDPLDLLCISTGNAASYPGAGQTSTGSDAIQQNGIPDYNYHLEVEENGVKVIKQFRSTGWRSCQSLKSSMTSNYAAGPYDAVSVGECVAYLYPDDPNGWDRNLPIGRLFFRWGFKNWLGPDFYSDSARKTLESRGLSPENFRGNNPNGGVLEPVICWEPRPYPAEGDFLSIAREFFNTAWEIMRDSYATTGVGPSHQTFHVATTPYNVNGFSDITGRGNVRPPYGGGAIPRFSLQFSGGGLEDLEGALPDFSELESPFLTEEAGMMASGFGNLEGAYEALASNATIWHYPATTANLRRNAIGSAAIPLLCSSSYALPSWLTSIPGSNAVSLDPHVDEPWDGRNVVKSLTRNPQIFFDPVEGLTFEPAERLISSYGSSYSMHGREYSLINRRNAEGEPMNSPLVNNFFATQSEARVGLGTAFELFYLGLLEESNNLDPIGSPTPPFITCLPRGDARIDRGAPELRGLPIGVEAVVEDFLDGSLMSRLATGREARSILRQLLSYEVSANVLESRLTDVTTTPSDAEQYVENLESYLVWRTLCLSPWLTQSSFLRLLDWFDTEMTKVIEGGVCEWALKTIGLTVLELWKQPVAGFEERGFSNPNSVFQNVAEGWQEFGWAERQDADFTVWALTWYPAELGLRASDADALTQIIEKPVKWGSTSADLGRVFAPSVVRTKDAFDALYTYFMDPAGLEADVGAGLAARYRFSLLFVPVSDTDDTMPRSAGVDESQGGFLTTPQYQNILADAMENYAETKPYLMQFQYLFAPFKPSEEHYRSQVPAEIETQLLDRGEQVGYNLVSSFLRSSARIRDFTQYMMRIAFGNLYSEYVETGELPLPPEGVNRRRYERDQGMNLTFLTQAAIGGRESLGGLARNPALPADVAEVVFNEWFEVSQNWNNLSYSRYYEDIMKALAENTACPSEILASIYAMNTGLQGAITSNPNCPYDILLEVFGLGEDGLWADDAAPISALKNPGLSQEEYVELYNLVMGQLERDARTMDTGDDTVSTPISFQVFGDDSMVQNFYADRTASSRTAHLTSVFSSHPSLRFWRGGSDKSQWAGAVAGGDGAWRNFAWPGLESNESLAKTWRLPGVGETVSGLNAGWFGSTSEEGFRSSGSEDMNLEAPFVLIKYNSTRAAGRGDGNQTTCPQFGDKPILGDSQFGQMLFIQKLYKRQIGRGELRQNEDGAWVGRRYVWSFDGFWYDENGNQHPGHTYEANSLDELFGWLGQERYEEIGFGEGVEGLKWSQGFVICITDEIICEMVGSEVSAFEEFFGDRETSYEPIPLWRQNWSAAESLSLMRSLVTKPWFEVDGPPTSLCLNTLRAQYRRRPLRVYLPGRAVDSMPVYGIGTIMLALNQPYEDEPKEGMWNSELVNYLAWDILQDGYDSFSQLTNLPVNGDTTSILLPLLYNDDICTAYLSEPEEIRDFAIRSNESNPVNVINIYLSLFGVSREQLQQDNVWCGDFEGTTFGSSRNQRRNIIKHLLTNNTYKKTLPIEFLLGLYTLQSVQNEELNNTIVSNLDSLRTQRLLEFNRAYANQRRMTLDLLANYGRESSEYSRGLISMGEDLEFSTFLIATSDTRRFDGNVVPWPGVNGNNLDAYRERVMANLESMVGLMTLSQLRDLVTSVNYSVEFARRIMLPMFDEYELGLREKGYEDEVAEALSVFLIRTEIEALVGSSVSSELVSQLPSEFANLPFQFTDLIDLEELAILDELIDEIYSEGPINTGDED